MKQTWTCVLEAEDSTVGEVMLTLVSKENDFVLN